MPCISSTDLINQYGNICAPGDRACWESQGVGINAGPFDPAPGGGPPDSCCSLPLSCNPPIDWSLITATIDGEQGEWRSAGNGFFSASKQNVANCGPGTGVNVEQAMAILFNCVNGYYKATIHYQFQYGVGNFIVIRIWTGDVVADSNGNPTGIANISGGANQYNQSNCDAEFPAGECTSCQSFLDKLPASQNPSVTFSRT